MICIFKKASDLKKIIGILNNMFNTITIQIEDGMMSILMLTACKYMLFDISITIDEIQEYTEPVYFSVYTKHFLESFNTLKAKHSAKFTILPSQLLVEIITDECIKRTYLHINPAQKLSAGDSLSYDKPIEVVNSNFQKLCKSLSNANRELILKGNTKRITLHSNLQNMYGHEVEFGDFKAAENDFEDVYLTEHFSSISKISTLNNKLYFYVCKDQPLCIEARFGNKSFFKVFLKNKKLAEPLD